MVFESQESADLPDYFTVGFEVFRRVSAYKKSKNFTRKLRNTGKGNCFFLVELCFTLSNSLLRN